MNFKAVFQKINLNWSRKLTYNVTLPNVEFRTSWCTTRSQNPSLVYSTPSELSAILCKPCSQISRFFLVQWNFPLYTRGVLGCLLGFWPSGPKPCGGNNKRIRILKIHLPLNLLRRVSSLFNCTLFASPSKFCLRRFFIFLTSEARF